MYTAVLPLHEIAFADKARVAVAASNVIFGDVGTIIIAIMIMISTFGCNNGLILAGARVYYTMAKDGLFFRQAGNLNKFNVPRQALWVQCVLACIWCLSGKYGEPAGYGVFCCSVVFIYLPLSGYSYSVNNAPEASRPLQGLRVPGVAADLYTYGCCVLYAAYSL